jgi:hypothetical protein
MEVIDQLHACVTLMSAVESPVAVEQDGRAPKIFLARQKLSPVENLPRIVILPAGI